MTKPAYTIDEAAAAVGLSPRKLSAEITAGRLKCKRSARNDDGDGVGTRLILDHQLRAWLEQLPDG